MSKVLIVEDDQSIAQVVKDALSDSKYTVDMVHRGEDARAYLRSVTYDLIIFDWQLPDCSGIELCNEYRAAGGASPVLFLTGRNAVPDRIVGLDSGADDYLTKPFDVRELLSRVRALLRRPPSVTYKTLKVRNIELDPVNHVVTMAGAEIKLYPKEFSLLELFMRNPQRVFSADDLLAKVWPTDSDASIETARTTILRLRQKVENDAENPLIRTIRGVGYRLEP
ncbi:MAG: response regulator transcription factor [Cyanobacteria bacterium SZAS LIN-2]|nr:response regulator transcription factor [Cyanobacteria bacterium SZAS LIN-3]MBS1995438.1 response regulator transcription factor [Cyanobacteria bacterium SZAS LIN-2]